LPDPSRKNGFRDRDSPGPDTGTLKVVHFCHSSMAAVSERFDVDPERTWAGTVLALLAVLVAGSLAFPERVYEGFVWQYFWGPVYADAHGANCAVMGVDGPELLGSTAACDAATGIVAYPGYTLVSEVGYAVVLILAVVGIAFLLRRLEIERHRAMYFGLFPFMFFGGALRVVEDANDAHFSQSGGFGGGGEFIVGYPLNTLFISPLIYVTVFVVALVALVAAIWIDRNDVVDRGFEYPLAATGTVATLGTLATLFGMAATTRYVTLHLPVLLVVVVGTVVITGITWLAIERVAPALDEGTELMGLPVLLGQVLDGVANVVGLDWAKALGLPGNLRPKHPVNQFVVTTTESILPASVTGVIGSAWPFLLVKVVAALFILWIFDEQIVEESPRYAIMLLLAAVAVGTGPGTRDVLRATFGV